MSSFSEKSKDLDHLAFEFLVELELHQIEPRALRKFKHCGINYLQNKKTVVLVASIVTKAKHNGLRVCVVLLAPVLCLNM